MCPSRLQPPPTPGVAFPDQNLDTAHDTLSFPDVYDGKCGCSVDLVAFHAAFLQLLVSPGFISLARFCSLSVLMPRFRLSFLFSPLVVVSLFLIFPFARWRRRSPLFSGKQQLASRMTWFGPLPFRFSCQGVWDGSQASIISSLFSEHPLCLLCRR